MVLGKVASSGNNCDPQEFDCLWSGTTGICVQGD